MKAALQLIGYATFFGLGLVQLFAVIDGIKVLLGVGSFLAFVIAAFFSWFPLVGTAAGMYGAVIAWDWSWLEAAALFFGVFIFGCALLGAAYLAERFSSRKDV